MQETVVMTGGSSGLGLVTLRALVEGGAEVLVVGRSEPELGEWVPADLTSLAEVREAASTIRTRCGEGIGALVLNAGGYGDGATSEGYDATFVLNYLSHYLLCEELWPALNADARIVLTTSGTHDPREKSRVAPPRHADALRLAKPTESDPLHAYAAAKLCVVLLARTLAARGESMSVLAYDPGPTPGTGLARSLSPIARTVWERAPWLVRMLLRDKANTVDDAGATLAKLARGQVPIPEGEVYAALRRGRLVWPGLCPNAASEDLREQLERDSSSLARGL